LLVGIILFGSFWAGRSAADDDLSLTLSESVWSRHMGGRGNINHYGTVVYTDLFLSYRSFYLYLWYSTGGDDWTASSNFGDEMVAKLGWKDIVWKKFYVDIGFMYDDAFPVWEGEYYDVFIPCFEIGRTFGSLNNFLTLFSRVEFNLAMGDAEGSTRSYVGIKHLWKLPHAFSAKESFDFLHDSGLFGSSPCISARYEGILSWQLSEKVSVEPVKFRFRVPLDKMTDDQKAETVIGAGITFYFK